MERRPKLALTLLIVIAAAASGAAFVRALDRPVIVVCGVLIPSIALVVTLSLAMRRGVMPAANAGPEDVATAIAERRGRFQVLRVGWMVLFMELGFFMPWWVSESPSPKVPLGFRFDALTALTPALAMIVFLAWTLALRFRIRVELHRLAKLGSTRSGQ